MRFLFCILLSLLLCCVSKPVSVAGGGSDTELSGRIVNASGNAVAHVVVRLFPSDFNPVCSKTLATNLSDTTNDSGDYNFRNIAQGSYNIVSICSANGTRALISGIVTSGHDTLAIPADTLQAPGIIHLYDLNKYVSASGYVFVPGTNLSVQVTAGDSDAVLDSVPVGIITACCYYVKATNKSDIIRSNIAVANNTASIVVYPFWKYSRHLILNTSISGANVGGNVNNFPVLARLTSAIFDFSQAQADGADIRFAKADGAPLSYEIERWDIVNKLAEIWVKVDTVFGNNDSQSIVMYWGNGAAIGESNSGIVFDTSSGFEGVWHLAEAGNTLAIDATKNHYDGTPSGMTSASAVSGVIGIAQAFDGTSSSLTMLNTASSKLDFAQNGNYSISLWAYIDTVDTAWCEIAGKGHEQYYLKFKGNGTKKATWEFVEFQDQQGWDFTEDLVPPAPGSKSWVYITGVRNGANQYLYINGSLASDTIKLQAGVYSRNSLDNFVIGKYARSVTIPYNEGWCYFDGMIDEVRVSSGVPSADWIQLCFMNQKSDDNLVLFK